jgi:hypothetical protein
MNIISQRAVQRNPRMQVGKLSQKKTLLKARVKTTHWEKVVQQVIMVLAKNQKALKRGQKEAKRASPKGARENRRSKVERKQKLVKQRMEKRKENLLKPMQKQE